jgi:hypothetical protein
VNSKRDPPYEELGRDDLLLGQATEGDKRRVLRQLDLGRKSAIQPLAEPAEEAPRGILISVNSRTQQSD